MDTFTTFVQGILVSDLHERKAEFESPQAKERFNKAMIATLRCTQNEQIQKAVEAVALVYDHIEVSLCLYFT